MVDREHQLPHTLVPLALAVTFVRSRLSSFAAPDATDPNAMATFIAATVPIWEYSEDPLQGVRPLRNAAGDGVFRNGGRELHFLDGQPTKYLLAVHVDDIGCVVEMLERPDRALFVRSRVLRALARRLVQQSRETGADAKRLRGAAAKLRAQGLGEDQSAEAFLDHK